MKVALGFKAHSGWAALVVIGLSGGGVHVVDRRRVELIDEGELWAKQPYHAAESLKTNEADELVERGVRSAHRIAILRMQEAVKRLSKTEHETTACAVLVPKPMPNWSTAEILAVHFRMHKAEGVLFPDALCQAAEDCSLPLFRVSEKTVFEEAEAALATSSTAVIETITALGRSVGPPWGKDQKHAALAAMIALRVNY